MKCEKCMYLETHSFTRNGKSYSQTCCAVTHAVNPLSCGIIVDKAIPTMNICFNCKNWIGGGDWGLSCKKDYYKCSSNGFDKACDKYERK